MKRAIAKGAAWMLLVRLAERSLGIVSLLILARVLVPADFGLVAMAMSVIAFIELASAFSFDLALIQRQHLTREHYDTAWTLQIAFGSGCAAIMALLAYPTAVFYAEPRLVPVMLVLAGSWAIQSVENIGVINFRRDMNFSREFGFLASKKLVGFVITVALALTLQSYWALVAGTVASRLAGVILSYAVQPYRPRFCLAASADLFSFSGWMFVISLIAFGGRRLPHFAIGRLYGAGPLGLYTVAAEIAYLPATDLIAPISRAVFPGYARVASNPEALRQNFLEVIGIIAIFALPASLGIAAIAAPLVQVMLGNNWSEAVILVQILAFAGAFHAAFSNHFSAWLALGKTRTVAFLEGMRFMLLWPLMLVMSGMLGVVGFAYAELSATILCAIVECVMLSRALRFSLRTYLGYLWRPVVAAALMYFAVTELLQELTLGPRALSTLTQLAGAIVTGIITYACALAILWLLAGRPRGAESLALERLAALRKRRARAGESATAADLD